MKTKPSTEFVLLGALMDGPKHGYEIRQFMDGSLDSTWFVGTSQLYLLLKKLEESGLFQSRRKQQETRPTKRVFFLTDEGRKVFLNWLYKPIDHMRDFRIEFLAKLFFFNHLSLEGGDRLIDLQVQRFEKLQESIKQKMESEENSYTQLVFGFKLATAKSRIQWLLKQAKPFMKKIHKRS